MLSKKATKKQITPIMMLGKYVYLFCHSGVARNKDNVFYSFENLAVILNWIFGNFGICYLLQNDMIPSKSSQSQQFSQIAVYWGPLTVLI